MPGNTADQFDWSSHVRDYNFKQNFSWFLNTDNRINFGLNLIRHRFEPGNIKASENSFFQTLNLTRYNAMDGSAYVSNEQKIGDLFSMEYGLRLSVFQQMGEGKVREYLNPDSPQADEVINKISYEKGERIGSPFINIEPRFSARLITGPTSSVKASYNRMAQNLHLISNTNSPTPLDIWLPSNKYIKPLISNQVRPSLRGDNRFLGIFTYGNEPQGLGNFYKWDIYINDTLLSQSDFLIFASDELVDGNYIYSFEIFTDFHQPSKPEDRRLKLGDTVLVKQTSISAFAYNFYFQLFNQAQTGSLFSVPPANIQGNFTASDGNPVLGLFTAHDVSNSNVVVIDEEIESGLRK